MVFAQDPVLNFQSMQIVLGSYLGARTDLAATEPLVSPAVLPDELLKQFPQTVIMVGDTDPIIDDSTFFFQRLREVNSFRYCSCWLLTSLAGWGSYKAADLSTTASWIPKFAIATTKCTSSYLRCREIY